MENLLIALIGSLIVLDTTVVFQFSFSQPLITCSILGWFFGDLQLGILVGWEVQVTSGLKPQEHVIIVGHRFLDEGQHVKVIKNVSNSREILNP